MDEKQRDLILGAVHEDAAFVGRYLSSLQRPGRERLASTLAFCMGSYLSLFIYESQRQIRVIDPKLARDLSDPAQHVLRRSRNSLKLFEDTNLGSEGVQSVFWDEITPTHRDYFVDLLPFPSLEPFATDLGVYRYDGRVIATTHSASFSLGFEASALPQGNLGTFTFETSREYGRYFALLGAKLDSSFVSFPDRLNSNLLSQSGEDYRAREYYPQIFNGPTTPGLNAALLLLLGHLNFIDSVISPEPDVERKQYSVFKIRFLGIYQIIRSLKIAQGRQHQELVSETIEILNSITQHPVAVDLMSNEFRPFRNTLMHHDIDSRIDFSRIDGNDLLNSLSIAALGHERAESLSKDLDTLISHAAQLMNSWL